MRLPLAGLLSGMSGVANLGRSEDVRSHLLVERIENGVVHVRGHGRRIVLEATGVDFELRSPCGQAALLEAMGELLRCLRGPVQILVRSRVCRPDEYLRTLDAWRGAWSGKRALREHRLAEYEEKVRLVAGDRTIEDRRCYVIVPDGGEHIASVLRRGGIAVRRLASAEIEELFYYAYDPALARLRRLRGRSAPATTIEVMPLRAGDVVSCSVRRADVRELLAPSVLEVGPFHVHCQNRDDTFVRMLYVQDYPPVVTPNWLRDVLAVEGNLDISMHIAPLAAPWFQLALYVAPYASSEHELERVTRAVEDRLAGLAFRTQRAHYRQEQGLNSVLPQAVDLLRQTRVIAARALAAAFPFDAADRVEPEGSLFGVVGDGPRARSLLILDPRTWEDPHLLVLGSAGSGKSANARERLLHEWIAGAHAAVIDPGGEYGALAAHCGGDVIPIYVGSSRTINVWDLDPETDGGPLVAKVPRLAGFWKLALGDLPEEELRLLEGAIAATYQRAGISPSDPGTWTQPPPLTSDFQQAIWDRYGADDRTRLPATSLCERVQRFCHGHLAPLFNQRTTVNLANDFLVFDVRVVREEQPDLLALVTWLVLDHLRSWMTSRVGRRVICVDELWPLARHHEGLALVDELARTARHAGTQLVLVSRHVGELLTSPRAAASLAGGSTAILHRQHPDDLARVIETFHLSAAEGRSLLSAERGRCLLVAGGDRVPVRTVDYEPEHDILCAEPFRCGRPHGGVDSQERDGRLDDADPQHDAESVHPVAQREPSGATT